ncbi:hypothetical protein J3F83DRAFT_754475 [Trichoderma novae-zelandiae]
MEAATGGQLLKAVEEACLDEVRFALGDDEFRPSPALWFDGVSRSSAGSPRFADRLCLKLRKLLQNILDSALQLVYIFSILDSLRASLSLEKSPANGAGIRRVKSTHLEQLDQLAARQFRATQAPTIALSGRSLPLVYKVISTLVSPPHAVALFVLDLEGRFDATRLTCADDDLQHVYVQQPPCDQVSSTNVEAIRSIISDAEHFMIYDKSSAASLSREFWGTIVLGGLGAGDLVAAWKGWLRVEREHVADYSMRITLEEAFERRSDRQEVVDRAGWVAASQWGRFVFLE